MSETNEQDRKTREYWANAYKGKSSIYDISTLDLNNDDSGSNSNNSKLPYAPTAVLTSQNQRKPITLRDLLNINLRND